MAHRPAVIYITETVCISAQVSSDTAGCLWAGLRDLAPQYECDLLAIGGDLRQSGIRSALHDIVSPSSADGFLVWRSRKSADAASYFSRFDHKPLVYLSIPHSSKPSVSIANRASMQEVVRHLIEQHGCQKIAYIGGPLDHLHAQQRLVGFHAGLLAAGLHPNPTLMTPPGVWSPASGAAAITCLLDERGLRPGIDLDAIVCVSDQVALGVLAELTRRQIRVPEQIRLTGFNNVREARVTFPALTTVSMPFAQQSRKALQRLLNIMGLLSSAAEDPEPESHVLIGESCGCGNQDLRHLYADIQGVAQSAAVTPNTNFSQRLYQHLLQTLRHSDALVAATQIALALENAWVQGEFLPVLRLIQPHVRVGYFGLTDQVFWQEFLGDFRCQAPEPLDRIRTEQTFEHFRRTVADLHTREQGQLVRWETQVATTLRALGVELSLAPDLPALLNLLVASLPLLDVHSCWLVAYDQPVVNTHLPMAGRLILAVEDGERYPLALDGVRFPLIDLIPMGYRAGRSAGVFAALPIMQREFEYGYVIFNQSRSTDWYESLVDLIGSALHSLHLREALASQTQRLDTSYQELMNAQRRLLEADKMAALGELVAGVAHEINTPVGVGVTAVSTLLDDARALTLLVERRQAGPIPGVVQNLQESAVIAMRNLERASQLIESFKLIAVDQTRAEVRTFNLGQYLQDVSRSVAPRLKPGGHRVEINCAPEIELTCDPSSIARILTNLMINSLLHGFEGRRNGLIVVDCRCANHQLLWDYHDNGLGMEKAVEEKIFHPFFTTKRGRGGTGLGMHIVYNLVTQGLKGSIQCQSELGVGTRFDISLPLS